MEDATNKELFDHICRKGSLKMKIYDNAFKVFSQFKEEVKQLADAYQRRERNTEFSHEIAFEFQDKGDFEFEVKFGGDILLFLLHTNIFEIPRAHDVMNTRYIKDDKERSYCGMINIYNFLADSFKYGREGDAGYLIGRVMVNKENHFFIEGKKEVGMIYHNFEKSVLDQEAIKQIITSAIEFTINFDLLIPPYENVSLISVLDIQRAMQGNMLKTGKRLGFKFQADIKEVQGLYDSE